MDWGCGRLPEPVSLPLLVPARVARMLVGAGVLAHMSLCLGVSVLMRPALRASQVLHQGRHILLVLGAPLLVLLIIVEVLAGCALLVGHLSLPEPHPGLHGHIPCVHLHADGLRVQLLGSLNCQLLDNPLCLLLLSLCGKGLQLIIVGHVAPAIVGELIVVLVHEGVDLAVASAVIVVVGLRDVQRSLKGRAGSKEVAERAHL